MGLSRGRPVPFGSGLSVSSVIDRGCADKRLAGERWSPVVGSDPYGRGRLSDCAQPPSGYSSRGLEFGTK